MWDIFSYILGMLGRLFMAIALVWATWAFRLTHPYLSIAGMGAAMWVAGRLLKDD